MVGLGEELQQPDAGQTDNELETTGPKNIAHQSASGPAKLYRTAHCLREQESRSKRSVSLLESTGLNTAAANIISMPIISDPSEDDDAHLFP